MRDFFIGWIIWQLVFIGYATGEIYNKMVDKTYDCNAIPTEKIPPIVWAVIPLVAFMPDLSSDYCKQIKQEKE